jgi:hypothetical protein
MDQEDRGKKSRFLKMFGCDWFLPKWLLDFDQCLLQQLFAVPVSSTTAAGPWQVLQLQQLFKFNQFPRQWPRWYLSVSSTINTRNLTSFSHTCYLSWPRFSYITAAWICIVSSRGLLEFRIFSTTAAALVQTSSPVAAGSRGHFFSRGCWN